MTNPKPQQRSRRKPSKPIAGRSLILAGALAGVLGGWGVLAVGEAQSVASDAANVDLSVAAANVTSSISTPAATGAAAPASIITLQLAPLPTVIPPVGASAITTLAPLAPLPEPIQIAPIPAAPQPSQSRPAARARSSN